MKTSSLATSASTLMLAMLSGLSPTAHAGHRLNHDAQFCNKSGSDGSLTIYWQGGIGNDSTTQDLRVLCPVVRMAGLTTTGDALVNAIDRNRNAGIQCSFYDQRAYGHAWTWSGWKTSTGSGNSNYVTFKFGPYNSQDSWGGFHHFHCIIPPKDSQYGASTIGSYSTGTDD
jgi:hypothetical protein